MKRNYFLKKKIWRTLNVTNLQIVYATIPVTHLFQVLPASIYYRHCVRKVKEFFLTNFDFDLLCGNKNLSWGKNKSIL